jgi:hypothetical protein
MGGVRHTYLIDVMIKCFDSLTCQSKSPQRPVCCVLRQKVAEKLYLFLMMRLYHYALPIAGIGFSSFDTPESVLSKF